MLKIPQPGVYETTPMGIAVRHRHLRAPLLTRVEQALKANPNLKSLVLESCQLRDKEYKRLADAFSRNQTLVGLAVINDSITLEGVSHLARVTKSHKRLQCLCLENIADLKGEKITCVAKMLMDSRLISFGLTEVDFAVGDARTLAAGLLRNRTLRWLSLRRTSLHDQHIEELAPALGSCRKLTNLDLSDNRIRTVGAAFLTHAVQTSQTLAVIDLSSNGYLGNPGVAQLMSAMAQQDFPTALKLSQCSISASECESLGRIFACNGSLAGLDLSHTSIGDEGCKALSVGLQENRTLMWLNLFNTQIGDAGCGYLGDVLQENTALKSLNLGANHFTANGIEDLASGLKVNAILKRLNLAHNNIGTQGEALADHDTLTDLEVKL